MVRVFCYTYNRCVPSLQTEPTELNMAILTQLDLEPSPAGR